MLNIRFPKKYKLRLNHLNLLSEIRAQHRNDSLILVSFFFLLKNELRKDVKMINNLLNCQCNLNCFFFQQSLTNKPRMPSLQRPACNQTTNNPDFKIPLLFLYFYRFSKIIWKNFKVKRKWLTSESNHNMNWVRLFINLIYWIISTRPFCLLFPQYPGKSDNKLEKRNNKWCHCIFAAILIWLEKGTGKKRRGIQIGNFHFYSITHSQLYLYSH